MGIARSLAANSVALANVLAFAMFLVLFASSALAQESPARPTKLVTDNAKILTSSEVEEIARSLAKISRYGLAQAIVYIDKKLPAGEDFEAYTLRAANTWGVGDDG